MRICRDWQAEIPEGSGVLALPATLATVLFLRQSRAIQAAPALRSPDLSRSKRHSDSQQRSRERRVT